MTYSEKLSDIIALGKCKVHYTQTREPVTQMDAPQNKCLFEDISNNVTVMLWTKILSIKMGNNSYIMKKKVMVLVHCTSPHRDLSNYMYDFSSCF